jgi:hypothetical protein
MWCTKNITFSIKISPQVELLPRCRFYGLPGKTDPTLITNTTPYIQHFEEGMFVFQLVMVIIS